MVWAAVGLGVALCALLLWGHRRANRWERTAELLDEALTCVKSDLSEALTTSARETQRADKAETRYDALVEKLQAKAAQRDDGIIHAKNSGDVRRIFEQQVMSQEMERDKAQEN